MKLTPELLLRYADGYLQPGEMAEVEKLLVADEIARKNLQLIQISGRSISKADISSDERIVADALKAKILSGELIPRNEGENTQTKQAHASGIKSRSEKDMKFGSWWGFGKVAAGVLVMLAGIYGGYMTGVGSVSVEDVDMASVPVWVARVVDYHTLYDRETLSGVILNPGVVDNLEDKFSALLSHQISIPNLGESDLEFMRGQVLKFEGEEIIQLAYLPKQSGKPVALCFRLSNGENSAPTYSQLRGLGVARWRQDGIEYILLGEQTQAQTIAVTEQAMARIANG